MGTRRAAPPTEVGPACPADTLLVSGWIHLAPLSSTAVQVRREMIVVGSDGVALGRVAAVVVDHATQATTHVLLGRHAPGLEYRLVSLSLIEQVDEAAVRLQISSLDVSRLPRRTTTECRPSHL